MLPCRELKEQSAKNENHFNEEVESTKTKAGKFEKKAFGNLECYFSALVL
jgi:hypothetical protein